MEGEKEVFIDWVVSHMPLHASKLSQHPEKLRLMTIPLGFNSVFKRFLSSSVGGLFCVSVSQQDFCAYPKEMIDYNVSFLFVILPPCPPWPNASFISPQTSLVLLKGSSR